GAKTRFSAFAHGVWLLLAIFFATDILNLIPFCVLAVILLRTGYKLARPETFIFLYKQGREQFYPFMVTILAILFTDLLVGVGIGIAYAVYFLIKHTYRAGYSVKIQEKYGEVYYRIELALNVSFLNKKRIIEILDEIPPKAIVNIIGTRSVYIDRDILEVFEKFKAKAKHRNIHLTLTDIPEVKVIDFH
ncbi:MAG: SulP family inorganic anion transporter, partial [Raineya sp.]